MEIIHRIIAALYALAAACLAGKWAICYAYEERGYMAAGGEYFFIIAVFAGTYKIMVLLFRILEEKER